MKILSNKLKNDILFMIFILAISCILILFGLLIGGFLNSLFWITFLIFANLYASYYANTVRRIIFCLLWIPISITVALVGEKVFIDFTENIYQFVILSLVYATIWGCGALAYNKEKYKVATSFIAAFLSTMVALITYISYVSTGKIIPENGLKFFNIFLLPLSIAGLWGNCCLNIMDMHKWSDEKSKVYLKIFLGKCNILFENGMESFIKWLYKIEQKRFNKYK